MCRGPSIRGPAWFKPYVAVSQLNSLTLFACSRCDFFRLVHERHDKGTVSPRERDRGYGLALLAWRLLGDPSVEPISAEASGVAGSAVSLTPWLFPDHVRGALFLGRFRNSPGHRRCPWTNRNLDGGATCLATPERASKARCNHRNATRIQWRALYYSLRGESLFRQSRGTAIWLSGTHLCVAISLCLSRATPL